MNNTGKGRKQLLPLLHGPHRLSLDFHSGCQVELGGEQVPALLHHQHTPWQKGGFRSIGCWSSGTTRELLAHILGLFRA